MRFSRLLAMALVGSGMLAVPHNTRAAADSVRITNGRYQIDFDRDVTQCSYSATVGVPSGAFTSPAFIQATPKPGVPNGVLVETDDKTGALIDSSFHLLVFCSR